MPLEAASVAGWIRGHIVELALTVLFGGLGVAALTRWIRTGFQASSWKEQLLFTLHVTARVGMWFAFAGFFLGFALLEEPQRFRWYLFVPLALAAAQFLTGVFLSRSPYARTRDREGEP